MTLEEQSEERNRLIEDAAKTLAYIQVRIFSKEHVYKVLTNEVSMMQELEKLEVLYTRRNALKKILDDL